jgi:N-acyl homoserine lactone hydrolase
MSGEIRVHMLDGGQMTVPRKNIFHIGGPATICEGDPITIPFPSFLIVHPEGNVVFDGGWQLEFTSPPGQAAAGMPEVSPDQHVLAQVGALGVDPSSVRYVIHSHLHNDHSGATGHFPGATELVHEEELAYALDPPWFSGFVYNRDDFDRPGVEWMTLGLTEEQPEHDVFGDGVLTLVFTPGHSVGHMSLIVESGEAAVILAADAADDRPHLDGEVLPGWYLDAAQSARSVERLRRHRDRLGGAEVVFGHSWDQWQSLPHGAESLI